MAVYFVDNDVDQATKKAFLGGSSLFASDPFQQFTVLIVVVFLFRMR